MDIQFNEKNGVKPEKIKVLICSMLDIITLAGLSVDGLSNRTLEQISMACLAMGSVTNSLKEIQASNYLTSKEIIRHWNKYYGDNMNEGSYDSIRDNCVKRLVEKGIAISQAKESSLTKNSSTAGYGLSDAFVELVNAYGTENQDSILEKFNLYQSNIDTSETNSSKRTEVLQKVSAKSMKKVFLLYLKKTSKQMENYNDYVESICKKIDPLLKDVGVDVSSVYQITNEDNLVTIVQSVIDKSPNLDGVLEDNWKKASSKNFKDYVLWTTLRQYRDYLVLLNASSFIFNIKQPTLSKTKHFGIIVKGFSSFFDALRTKPFLLLAGISGTGKSQKVQELAFMTCPEGELRDEGGTTPGNYCLVEVKPNWHDSTELLGYYSALSGKYELTDFIRFVYKATQNTNVPFFLCLDEMNLAPVEQYFAEFLCVLETRKKVGNEIQTQYLLSKDRFSNCELQKKVLVKENGDIIEGDKQYKLEFMYSEKDTEIIKYLKENGLTLPDNLFVIGTVNMDDTTHQFSRKVIDRAFTIEMNGGKMAEMFSPESKVLLEYRDEPIPLDAFKSQFIRAYEVFEDARFAKYKDVISTRIPQLLGDSDGTADADSINGVLNETPFRVSYRVQNELVLYLSTLIERANFPEPDQIEELIGEATLAILLEKVLPRVQGEQKQLETQKGKSNVLKDLKTFVENHFKPEEETDANSLYNRVIRKLKEMDDKLVNYYTNFF
jgi:hypothetical protein